MTNRQRAAQETRRKLLEAAKALVCEKGLVNTSVEEITKACGVSNGTFYTYFKRKEDIVLALSQELYQDVLEKSAAYVGGFLERLRFFMVNFSGYIEKSSVKLCQEWVRNTVDPDLLAETEQERKLTQDLNAVQALLEAAVARGELRTDTPQRLLAHTLVDLLYGEMLCWAMSGGSYSFQARTQEFCDNFLGALLAPYLTERTSDAT